MEIHITDLILLSLISLFLPISALAETGIASKYHKDQGIADDPAVVFSEDFERPLAAIFANWNGQSTNALSHSSHTPTRSGGDKSIQIKAVGISGTLYKPLNRSYNQLYFRYYVKFGGNGFHHTGGYIGGYDPLTNWPQGDAGLKGKRANGDRLFAIGFEERNGKYLDFYNNWIDMPGSSWQGMYYGRSLLKTENIPLIPDQWYCAELMVKVNSAPDVKDGELALWMDGKLIVHFRPGNPKGFWDRSGGWHRDANSPPFEGFLWRDTLSYGINWIKIQNYDAKPDVWFDDMVVATNYIGPINNVLSKPVILGDDITAQPTPAERQRETVSVADFASSNSPTAGIQEAIEALGRNGGVVTIPPGEYLLRQSIRVRSHVTLQGAGEKTVLRKAAQVGSRLAAPADAESRSVRVQDATGFHEGDEIGIFDQTTVGWLHAHAVVKGVQGNELLLDRRIGRAFDPKEGASVINYFPAITGSELLSNVVLKDLTIDGRSEENPGLSIVAARAPGKPTDLGFTFAAINLVDVTDSRIEGCRIKEWPSDGISMQRGNGNLVTKCVVESCRGPGYHPGGGLHDSVFSDNESRGNLDDGFYFCARVERVVVRNNSFIGNQGNGVGGLGDSGDKDNIVENNLCEANGRSGIALWDGESNTVRNNSCINNSQSFPGQWNGITLAKTERSVVSGNRCFDTQQNKTQKHGIEELSDCHANTITNNDCRGNAQSGLALTGQDSHRNGNLE